MDVTIYTRAEKGSKLSSTEYDASLTNLKAAIEGSQSELAGAALTLADDVAGSFTPTSTYGLLIISSSVSELCSVIAFGAVASPFCSGMILGEEVEVTTGALAGTTGTDGKLTVSAHTDGKVYFENRRGASRTIKYLVI